MGMRGLAISTLTALSLCTLSVWGCGIGVVGEGGWGEGGGGGGSTDDISGKKSFEECTAVAISAKPIFKPADIIFTIDNTPSMLDEINDIRANMNAFSKQIMDSGIDVRIVVISCLPGECDNDKWHGICIDPPLGAVGGCEDEGPYDDTQMPHYLHVSERIPSLKGLSRTIQTYGTWKSMLREGALKHFVTVSDDNDEWSASSFNSALLTLNPSLSGYKYHGIFSYKSKEDACAISTSEPCCKYAAPGGEGKVYKELVKMNGGVSGDLCLQHFDPVFKQVATSVITGSKIDCTWRLPPPPVDKEIDPNKINVEYADGNGGSHLLGRVDSSAECGAVAQGWYYDDPAMPSTVTACPQTCKWMQGGAGAEVTIRFGCRTKIAPLQ